MIRMIEGVEYHRYLVRFSVRANGRWLRRRLVHWSPGYPWIMEEVARGLGALYGLDNIKPQSVTIEGSE